MGLRRWMPLSAMAMAAVSGCAGHPEAARPAAPAASLATAKTVTTPAPAFGTVRVRIDPAAEEQGATIRALLAPFSFVTIGEPADYLVTTKPDFPLDIQLHDLRQPPRVWQHQFPGDLTLGDEPTSYSIGNLAEPATADRLAATLTAAARIRTVLDRSLASMQGVEACVVITESVNDGEPPVPPECVSLDRLGTRNIVIADWVSAIRVRNTSDSDRYVAVASADLSLKFDSAVFDNGPKVRKLAPGQTIEFNSNIAAYVTPRDPRVFILASARPFDVDQFTQPAPLEPTWPCNSESTLDLCRPNLSPVVLNDDLAVRSIQLHILPEPQPAMGNAADATALMAIWMAQFYSVIPYTQAEIDADRALPETNPDKQFLSLRSPQERQHRCGGSLIGPNLILTAAHCVAKGQYAGDGIRKMMKDRRIRLGSLRLGEGGQTYAIAGVAVHPGYDGKHPNNDIALLLLQPDRGTVPLRDPIGPVAVADKSLPAGVRATAFGYGLTGAVAPNGNIMMTVDQRIQDNKEVLQYGAMRSVSLADCKRKLANEVVPGMVCMFSTEALAGGSSAEGVFTCRGDSGGPLVRKLGGRDVLVGVVSWSKGCGYKDYPSVFTDVGSYAAWIAAARAELKPGAAIRPKDPARP